ncbi:2-hydroxychromene-2-carboxylate isomerase [Pseudomonas sp. 5P_3.1_Bac2]|uniref:2-hydroxychromene-2-carboxylate isomerase n=1 Tax=Pseudomonas sp. 5P_3.1_Bac2 TaxID=2971617 RepID=UPI0021C76D6F|nr:2-hydroxychromene-2-carboxylate isomerase [Pseudomonas sp. 5P_3.1_Bac2]MCU1717867.1 2-hydroxychromene-2-carboxylate isomerase [Pseudomonas sp. 5P_3.1_Bac2]
MSKSVEFFFDFGSPTSYLAFTQLPAIAQATGAQIIWRPLLLGALFKAIGNQSPVSLPAKGRYMFQDMARFAKRYEVPLKLNPFFPINTLQLMRGAVAYAGTPEFERYMQAIYQGIWVQQLNLGDAQVLAQLLTEAGFNPTEFAAKIADEAVKQQLKDNTDEAVKRGVFGAPTFFIDGQMYFGQDRLDFVAAALKAE